MILISTLSHFKHRYTLIILSVFSLITLWFSISYSAAIPPETQLKKDTAEQYQELHFLAKKGVQYTLQKSQDLSNWNNDFTFIGDGKLVKLRLFALHANVLPKNGNDAAFTTVSAQVRKVNTGGTSIAWISLEDQTIKRAYLSTIELDSNFPSSYTGLKNGYYLFLSLASPTATPKPDSVVSGSDLAFKNTLATLLSSINNDTVAGNPPLRPHRPPLTGKKQFWRIKTNPDIDSDGDGVSDSDEADNGADSFDEDDGGETTGEDIDTDGDGIPDLADADPLDKAITWKRSPDAPFILIDIGLPAGVDLADDWNYDLGEGGHVLLSRTTTLTWDESSKMFDKSSFKTYVYDGKKWSDNLPLSNTIRGLGVSIDSLGNIYGIGYGPPKDPNGLGIYAVSFKWNKPETPPTEADPVWAAPVMEEQQELYTYSTAHEDTTNFINSFYYNSSSGKNFLYGTTGHFIVGSDPVTGRLALHRQNPNGRITTSLPALNSSVHFQLAGDPSGWHAASWFEVTNSGAQTKHIFSKLSSENLLIDANPPTGDALLQLTDIASVKGGGIPTGISDILTWSYGSDGLLIGSRSVEDGVVTWQPSSKADQTQRIGGKINSRGEGLKAKSIWRNGKWKNLSTYISEEEWKSAEAIDINDQGVILIKDPVAKKLALLLPIEMWDINDHENENDDKPVDMLTKALDFEGAKPLDMADAEDIKKLQRFLATVLDGSPITSPPYKQNLVTLHPAKKYFHGGWKTFKDPEDINGVLDIKTSEAIVRAQKLEGFLVSPQNNSRMVTKVPGDIMDRARNTPPLDNNIAWIDAHISEENPAPRMPQLELRVKQLPANLKLESKIEVMYERGNGETKFAAPRGLPEDTVKLPAEDFGIAVAGNWKIHEEASWAQQLAEKGFFGGNVKLTYVIKDENDVVIKTQNLYFRIGGKNPNDKKCRTYIDDTVGAQYKNFAYAIAKHETHGKNSGLDGEFYNQFGLRPRHVANNGLPIYNFDYSAGPGGYGIFQITGDKSNNLIDIPRKQIWNWQDNVKAVVPILDAKKSRQDTAVRAFGAGVVLNGNYTLKGKTLSKIEWGIIVNYNGNKDCATHPSSDIKYKVPWLYIPSSSSWKFDDNNNFYGELVSKKLD